MAHYYEIRAVDPVCGMEVSRDASSLVATFKARTYYFCAECCVSAFEKNPEKYLKLKGRVGRFLVRLIKTNEKVLGRAGPPCH